MMSSNGGGWRIIARLEILLLLVFFVGCIVLAGPRMCLPKRLPKRVLDATMRELRTQLAQYYADQGTYPPRYGYLDPEAFASWQDSLEGNPDAAPPPDAELYNLKPYLSFLGLQQNLDYYDLFSKDYDADRDNRISLLEFSPIGVKNEVSGHVEMYPETPNPRLFDGKTVDEELRRMRESKGHPRPIFYLPVNSEQIKLARDYWISMGDYYGEAWDTTDPRIAQISFPPEKYDAFALVSVGPDRNTFGVIPRAGDPAAQQVAEAFPLTKYHILVLRAFFLATRDLNENYALDFHYGARKEGEAKERSYPVPGGQGPGSNDLPNPRSPKGAGPYIFVYQ